MTACREHAVCVRVGDKELCQLGLRVVEDADGRVHQHTDQHAVVVLELERAEDAEQVKEAAQVLSTHTHEANVSSYALGAGGARVLCAPDAAR